jgi:hypothetical protein
VNGFTLDFCADAYGDVVRKRISAPKRRPAMKTFITALVLVLVLATVTSMIALTAPGDRPHSDPGIHTAGHHQKVAFLY